MLLITICFNRRFAWIAILLCGLCAAGEAALVKQNDLTNQLTASPDGMNITLDTSTNLQWLDLTLTAGRSYDDVASEFGAGGDFEGFRYATTAEVTALWGELGFAPGFSPSSSNPAILDAVSHLGNTSTSTAGVAVVGLFDDTATGTDPTRVGWARAFVIPANPSWQADITLDMRPTSQAEAGTGSYLVRTAAASVPEPAAIASTMLLAALLAGVWLAKAARNNLATLFSKRCFPLLAMPLLCFTAAPLQAEMIQYSFTGSVTEVQLNPLDDPAYGPIEAGTTVSGSFVAKTTPFNTGSLSIFDFANYEVISFQLNVGNFTMSRPATATPTAGSLFIANATPSGSSDTFGVITGVDANTILGLTPNNAEVTLSDSSKSVFTDTSAPFPAPSPASFNTHIGRVNLTSSPTSGVVSQIRFELTSLDATLVSVSEPASLPLAALLVLATAVVWRLVRYRVKRNADKSRAMRLPVGA